MSLYQNFKQGLLVVAAGAGLSVALTGAAAAQQCPDWSLNGIPISTDAETAWVPQQFPMFAGGGLDLRECGSVPGVGHITPAPNFTVSYDARNLGRDLEFRVQSECDTTLLINDSSANWSFNDDEDGTLSPRIRLPNAPSGRYDIWVGTYSSSACQATLIAETFQGSGGGTGTPAPTCPDWSLGGAEVELGAGAVESRPVIAGGPINMFNNLCDIPGHGYVAQAPDFSLYYDGATPLNISVTADCDTVMLVNTPTTDWAFNDDSNGLQPALSFTTPMQGRYDVWIGTYGSSTCQANVTFASLGAQTPSAPQGK